ncbi:uncharacterized protein LOC124910420 [Impatiens glandulifera]|uniref:uncharacterized protein LOC124910420 n=1 Tax=Impatiens glandulifera TaxID=253017 RepID=UPI001FB0CD3E|nr:uncharacterized protein LOC124910420 [Impatiens glandulifera]
MTKKSSRPQKNDREQVKCICSFISVFDFRIRWSTRKLISEQKHEIQTIKTDKVSVKDIVQKEMCFEEEEEEKGNSSDLGETVKEIVNDLQKPSSKKELISKILNDLSFNEVESLAGVNTQKNRNLFRRKRKPRLEISNRIVILKPGSSRKLSSGLSSDLEKKGNKTERFSSQFSFTEIKKKLKHAITKDRNRIPYQRLVENTEKNTVKGNLGWNSPTRDHFFHERFIMPVFGSKKEQDKAGARNLKDEGQKRLSEMILTSGDDEIVNLSNPEASETFEHNDILGSCEKTTFDCQTLSRLKISKSTDLFLGRECDTSDVSEIELSSFDLTCFQKMDLFQEDESLLTSPTTHHSIPPNVDVLECSSMRPERLSPISVLESIVADDDSVSPPTAKSTKRTVEPRRFSFEETVNDPVVCIGNRLADEESAFEYVEAVLLASGINWDEFLSRWISSDPILDSSLFHEVELFSSRSLHDQKVLFDCTNEILDDICERYFSRYPNVVLCRPAGEDVIREVWKGVDSNLSWPTPFTTLDDAVKRDMEKNREWTSLQSETEKVGIDIEEIILEQLMEDTILCIPNEVVHAIN